MKKLTPMIVAVALVLPAMMTPTAHAKELYGGGIKEVIKVEANKWMQRCYRQRDGTLVCYGSNGPFTPNK